MRIVRNPCDAVTKAAADPAGPAPTIATVGLLRFMVIRISTPSAEPWMPLILSQDFIVA
jgi:hypothetical protein